LKLEISCDSANKVYEHRFLKAARDRVVFLYLFIDSSPLATVRRNAVTAAVDRLTNDRKELYKQVKYHGKEL
jgi:hypothetical protein